MTPPGPTICLSMIVKNEVAVIKRCLDSVRPLISHWVIVDTGSTDGTQELIKQLMADIPGTLYEREWRDFAHNRSEALTLARPCADYSLVIDADDKLELPANFEMPVLTADCYSVTICDDPLHYPRTQIVNNRLAWRYRGVLHEFMDCESAHTNAHLEINMRRNHDGARRKEAGIFLRDVAIFEQALLHEQDAYLRTRYTFYLAQSYRDAGDPTKAIDRYLARAQMGGWAEEVYISYYQAAKLMERLNFPDETVLKHYALASQTLPSRSEAAHGASRYCRLKQLYDRGYQFAKAHLGQTLPAGALFAEVWIYTTGLWDEFAVNAYWCAQYAECLDACLKILETGEMPADQLPRVFMNARYALGKLQNPVPQATSAATPGPAQVPSRPFATFDLAALGIPPVAEALQIMEVGASVINETPIYKALLDQGKAHLHAFEGDPRQIERIRTTYPHQSSIYNDFLFDGTAQSLHIARPESGMTSLLKPRLAALQFFNGFERFGHIDRVESVHTKRLDDIAELPGIDFLKMDIQGAELTVLKHGTRKLQGCLAVQLEVSHVCLYEGQPSFGEVDVWMRSQGFLPHCFLEVKRWSIAPTVFERNFRVPGQQLLESDLVYIRDPLRLDLLSASQLMKYFFIAHDCLKSIDLAVHLLRELENRETLARGTHTRYLEATGTTAA